MLCWAQLKSLVFIMCVLSLSRDLNSETRHHDTVSLWKLLCSGIFSLFHCIQMQWPVSIHLNQRSNMSRCIITRCMIWISSVVDTEAHSSLRNGFKIEQYILPQHFCVLLCRSNICSESPLIICLVLSEIWEGLHVIFLQLHSVVLTLYLTLWVFFY